jgi:hypothetical protein
MHSGRALVEASMETLEYGYFGIHGLLLLVGLQ